MAIPPNQPKFQASCFKPLIDPGTPASAQSPSPSPTSSAASFSMLNDPRLNHHHPMVRGVIVQHIRPHTPFDQQLQPVLAVQAINPAPAPVTAQAAQAAASSAQSAAPATPKPGQP